MKTVVIPTIIEGHRSIAQALEAYLRPTYDARILHYKIPEFDTYLPIYQLFPGFFRVPYKLAEMTRVRALLKTVATEKYKDILFDLIEKEKPDALISTYFVYDQICGLYAKEHGIASFNVIANPRTFHPIELCSESTANLVYDKYAKHRAMAMDIPVDTHITGWFVRPQFTPSKNKARRRKSLHLDSDKLTFLVCGGSDGTSMILKILPFLYQVDTPLQVIVVCGNNRSLYKAVKGFEKMISYVKKSSSVTIHTHGFITGIEKYIQASDLVIGKAGPNLLFETVACHVPFFAVAHISGTEDGNLDIIRKNKLGFVEENPLKASKILLHVTKNPSLLGSFSPGIEKIAAYNSKSGYRLTKLLSRYFR